jgi:hypothetical protein
MVDLIATGRSSFEAVLFPVPPIFNSGSARFSLEDLSTITGAGFFLRLGSRPELR